MGFAACASPDSGSPPRLPAGIRRGISLVSLTNAGQANLGLGVLAMDARLSGLVCPVGPLCGLPIIPMPFSPFRVIVLPKRPR